MGIRVTDRRLDDPCLLAVGEDGQEAVVHRREFDRATGLPKHFGRHAMLGCGGGRCAVNESLQSSQLRLEQDEFTEVSMVRAGHRPELFDKRGLGDELRDDHVMTAAEVRAGGGDGNAPSEPESLVVPRPATDEGTQAVNVQVERERMILDEQASQGRFSRGWWAVEEDQLWHRRRLGEH